MNKRLLIVYLMIVFIIIANVLYYKSLYYKQIDYITKLLDRQVQITGLSVDNTNNSFISDLNQIIFSEDLSLFFSNQAQHLRAIERMKLFFSKYPDLINGIKYFDNNKNEFTLKRDETQTSWLEQQFVLHVQGEIITKEKLVRGARDYEYYLPVLLDGSPAGNIVVAIDFKRYFSEIFSSFNLKDYQWQWVVSDSGEIIYNNYGASIKFTELNKLAKALEEGSVSNMNHHAEIEGKSKKIISSFYSTQLLYRNIGLVFSSPTDIFQNYIVRNSLLMGLGTLLVIQFIVLLLWRYLKSGNLEIEKLRNSEKLLLRMIEEMPVGIIIYNRNREIIKANKVAASLYSYSDESDMEGKIYPEPSLTDINAYFSKHLRGRSFRPDQFVIIKKEVGEIIIYRSSIPVHFMDEEGIMEMLIDVTLLESARKQEAEASVAKSEFLARMSYELRTPLNGIIGLADIIGNHNLAKEDMEILGLLRRSADVLLKIIDDILDFSKIESGKMILEEIPFSLREEVVYCYDLARTNLDENIIKLSCHVNDDVPDRIVGDPFRFRQILANLLNHSIENTLKGEIQLYCRLIERKNRMLKLGFVLADTGKKFDNVTLKKIFGDYVNVESKVIRKADESGFDTILARQLVELMGGEFSAGSPSGISGELGTKISFSILAYSDERIKKNLPLDKVQKYEDIRTLVITGDQARAEEILGLLHKLGLSVTITTFQHSTINQIKANLNYPDQRYFLIVIIDDVEFDGFKIAELLQENNLSEKYIILMLSSNDIKGNYLKCMTLGIDNYVVKPFEIKELFDVVRSSFHQVDKIMPEREINNFRTDLRVLVVEDNKMNQKVIGTMLKSLGYFFDFADDGHEGYIQAKTRRYDVIFMDLIMPEMDGFESARKIIEYDPTTLIVAFTADNMPDSRRKAEMSGIRDFITKPVRIDDLRKFFTRYFAKE